MTLVQITADVRAPVQAVFDAITDPNRGPQWNPNILDVSDLSSNLVQQGTTWRQTTVLMGRPMQLACRVLTFDPPREGVLEVSGPYHAKITTRCRPSEGGTRVSQSVEFQLPGGPLGSMAGKLVAVKLQQEVAATLARLKEIVESESGGARGSGTQ
jgi:uncharacterized protein YndB with AHSA1/START domain